MKRGKGDTSRNAFVLILLVLIGLLLIFALTNRSFWNRLTGKASTESAQVSATVRNTAPTIITDNLDGTTAIDLIPESTKDVVIIFKAEDKNGYNDISTSSAQTYASISRGAVTRQSSPGSCTKAPGGNPKRADISCTVSMQYYDENADWTVTVSAGDIGGLSASQNTRTITVNLLKDIRIATTPPSGPITLSFPTIDPGAVNQGATNDALVITNRGNYEGTITVQGTNLVNGPDSIPIGNFNADITDAGSCILPGEGGTATALSTSVVIANSILPRTPPGNAEDLFFCAESIPDPIISGDYTGTWTIVI